MSMMSTSAEAATVSSGDAAPHVVVDFAGMAQILSDGTFIRHTDAASGLPPASVPSTLSTQWKDVAYDPDHDLMLRMYRPACGADDSEAATEKLPVLVYFHGGGFCVGSFSLPNTHVSCLRLAGELPAIVLSADYRLAPEHRLPAAHDDARTLVSWMRNQAAASPADDADPWLAESADFGRVFVTGDSAGGNIAHHVAVAVGSGLLGVTPARVAGYVLLWPFFAGVERTASEAEYPPGPFLTLPVSDQFLRLSLPSEGDTRDHPVVNPFGPDSPALDAVVLAPVLVVGGEHDLLRDRIADYVARLRAMGKPVELVEFQGQHHGFFIVEPWSDAGNELIRVVRRFVYGRTSCH